MERKKKNVKKASAVCSQNIQIPKPPMHTKNTNKYKLIISLDSTCLQILFLLLPYIAVLFELDKSRGTRPYVSVSMMATRDTMTAGTPETNGLREGFIFKLKGSVSPKFVDCLHLTGPCVLRLYSPHPTRLILSRYRLT